MTTVRSRDEATKACAGWEGNGRSAAPAAGAGDSPGARGGRHPRARRAGHPPAGPAVRSRRRRRRRRLRARARVAGAARRRLRGRRTALVTVVAILVAMLAIASQGLYRSRTCGVRAVETVRLGRAGAVAAVARSWPSSSTSTSPSARGRRRRRRHLVPAQRQPRPLRRLAAQAPHPGSLLPPGRRGRYRRRGLRALQAGRAAPRARPPGLRRRRPPAPLAQWDGEVQWLGEVADADVPRSRPPAPTA